MMLSHSSFLLKSYDDLDGDIGIRLNFFMSLSTDTWRGHLVLLGQSQNLMMFIEKQPKILQYGNRLLLIEMNGRIKDMICLSDMVHTGGEDCLEICGLIKQPWLQLMCCAICLLHSHNFR